MSNRLTELINEYMPSQIRRKQAVAQENPYTQSLPGLEPADDLYKDDQPDQTEIERRMESAIRGKDNQLYDQSMMKEPVYDQDQIQILNDIAADESIPAMVHYISSLSRLGVKAKARLIARTIAFQSKNQVFSNIINLQDYQMAQDDFQNAQIMSAADFTAFDVNADYFTINAIQEAQFNIRLRRSRDALALQQINTQRQEYLQPGSSPAPEEKKLRSRIPFIGGG